MVKPAQAPPGWLRTLRDAGLMVVACIVAGIVANAINPNRIPLVASQEYETLVPCPEPGGEVTAFAASDPLLVAPDTFLVDARDPGLAAQWRFMEAQNVPYDYLDPTPEEVLRELARAIAASRAHRVLVYGDGDDPDSGEQLAREIAGHGIKGVGFIAGGAPALVAAHKVAP